MPRNRQKPAFCRANALQDIVERRANKIAIKRSCLVSCFLKRLLQNKQMSFYPIFSSPPLVNKIQRPRYALLKTKGAVIHYCRDRKRKQMKWGGLKPFRLSLLGSEIFRRN